MLAQHRFERVAIQKIRTDKLHAIANGGQSLVVARRVANDADNLVSVLEQELCEVRAILTTNAGDDCPRRAQWRPRTYVHAWLRPIERIETMTAA